MLLANAWDSGSARLLASLGFEALATTSSGFAATLGRLDGAVTRDEAIAHCASIVAASELPVSADLENGFADDPAGVAETIDLALRAGLAGCSVEDYSGEERRSTSSAAATERVAAAAEAAHAGPVQLVLTARAENHLRGRPDLDDTIARLQAYEQAGADVLYAPGLSDLQDIRRVVESVGLPGQRARARRARRRSPSWRRSAWRASRSAAPSPSRRSARSSRRRTSCASGEPTATGRT